ncbi:MAG: hypothetical protein WBP64_13880 [Nitrososphaeraceae archaeon]
MQDDDVSELCNKAAGAKERAGFIDDATSIKGKDNFCMLSVLQAVKA